MEGRSHHRVPEPLVPVMVHLQGIEEIGREQAWEGQGVRVSQKLPGKHSGPPTPGQDTTPLPPKLPTLSAKGEETGAHQQRATQTGPALAHQMALRTRLGTSGLSLDSLDFTWRGAGTGCVPLAGWRPLKAALFLSGAALNTGLRCFG